jgi:hypothetical protein
MRRFRPNQAYEPKNRADERLSYFCRWMRGHYKSIFKLQGMFQAMLSMPTLTRRPILPGTLNAFTDKHRHIGVGESYFGFNLSRCSLLECNTASLFQMIHVSTVCPSGYRGLNPIRKVTLDISLLSGSDCNHAWSHIPALLCGVEFT